MQMIDRRPPNAIAALEQARAQLEIALGASAHWRALGHATLPANRAAHERALADNPVYHAWKLLGQALGELQPGSTMGWAMQTDMQTDMGTDMGRGHIAPAAGPPQVRRRRVELRHVLDRIRVEAPFDSAEPGAGAAAAADHGPDAPLAAPAIAPGDIEIEEAAVSFVVREPVQPASQAAPAAESAVEPWGTQEEGREAAGASGPAPGSGDDGDGEDTETEVRIVPRRS
jgi:hypothetical protein